jgi:hypothetical protein
MSGHPKGKVRLMPAVIRGEHENLNFYRLKGCNGLPVYEILQDYGVGVGIVFINI